MDREEALKKVRQMSLPKETMEILEALAPELAESEDERITDTIFNCLYQCCDTGFISGTQRDNALAYLEKQKDLDKMIVISPEVWDNAISDAYENGKKEGEKQKEQKPVPPLPPFDEMTPEDKMNHPLYLEGFDMGRDVQKVFDEQKPVERSLEDSRIIGFVYALLNQIKWKDNWAMSKDECLRRLNNYRPQKPAEWSDEDEKIRQSIIKDIEFERNYTSATTNKTVEIEKYNEQINWLKSLSINLKKKNEDIEKLCSNEWSEEDEKHKQWILECLADGKRKVPEFAEQYQAAFNWLKFLCPSWKPSEQEKAALRTAICVLTEERNFPKTAEQLQAILNAFDCKETRKEWKPSEEQMEALERTIQLANFGCGEDRRKALVSLYAELKKLT